MVTGILVASAFLVWCVCYGCYANYFPTYLQQACGMSIQGSSLSLLVINVVAIVCSIAAGPILGKMKAYKGAIIVGYFIVGLLLVIGWKNPPLSGAMPWITAVVRGVCFGLVPVSTRQMVPMAIIDEAKMDYILAIMSFVTYLGMAWATPFSMMLAGSGGWALPTTVTGVVWGIIGIVVVLFGVKSDKKLIEANWS
jgi:predicted MFS family arabinose efflux permease